MQKIKKLFLLASATLLLTGCDNPDSSSDSSSSEDRSSASSDIMLLDWSEQQKELLKQYCGEVLPYPSAYAGPSSITLTQQYDENTSTTYLLIAEESQTFTLSDYYKELESGSWKGVRDYNGNINQVGSDGETYYELTKIDAENKKGYEIIYSHYSEGNEETDKKYNLIRCFNDLGYEIDNETAWKDEEKAIFQNALTIVPPLLKSGTNRKVDKSGEDMVYVYDTLAKDLSKENAEILKNDGYVLNEALSKDKGSYVLEKKVSESETVIASLFYSGGNIATFAYQVETKYSSEWPSALATAFKGKTGFDLPTFYSSVGYYYYTKKGVTTIYSYISDASAYYTNLQMTLENLLVLDNNRSWFTDWEEKYYIRPQMGYDQQVSSQVFGYSFGMLDKPYDDMIDGWPTETIDKFLKDNNIEGTCPAFDVLSLSSSSKVRVSATNYDDVYPAIYAAVKASPEDYGLSETATEEQIKAKADEKAKEKTELKIKFYDKGVYDEYGESKIFKVYDKLETTLKDLCWSTNFEYDYRYTKAFENADGNIRVGIGTYANVTTLTLTYGSNKAHTPTFRFEAKEQSLNAGAYYNLDLSIDMLPLDKVEYSSDNSLISVNDEGRVHVSSEAEGGTTATITATVKDAAGNTYSDTCVITVSVSYTKETAAQKVAKLYNDYYNLAETDEKAAKLEITYNDDWAIYYFRVQTEFATFAELEDFVDKNLVPTGFKTYYDTWETDMAYDDGTQYEGHSYSYMDENWNNISINYNVYKDSSTDKIVLYVRIA